MEGPTQSVAAAGRVESPGTANSPCSRPISSDRSPVSCSCLARSHPLLLILDDLQWADAGSVSLLFHLGRRLAGSRILVVAAYRPDAIALHAEDARHPLESVVNELQRVSGDRPIDLDQCEGRQFVEALLDAEPNRLSAGFRAQLARHTEGHPLFTVELLRGLQEGGDLVRDAEGCWVEGPALHWEKLPARVEAVIAERIGRLPDRCRALLAAASVEGEEFTAEIIAACAGCGRVRDPPMSGWRPG